MGSRAFLNAWSSTKWYASEVSNTIATYVFIDEELRTEYLPRLTYCDYWFATSTPGIIYQFIWLVYYLFTVKIQHWSNEEQLLHNEGMEVTVPAWVVVTSMVFCSTISACVGGSASYLGYVWLVFVAKIDMTSGKDTWLLIQAFSLVSSTFSLTVARARLDHQTLLYGATGGFVGVIIGFETTFLNSLYSTVYCGVICLALSYGTMLHHITGTGNVVFYETWGWPELACRETRLGVNWNVFLVVAVGIVGGISTAFFGLGVEMFLYTLMVTQFRISEKVAAPTTIIVGSITTVFALVYRSISAVAGSTTATTPAAYLFSGGSVGLALQAAPWVMAAAPVAALSASYLSRHAIALVSYVANTTVFVAVLVGIQPWTTRSTESPALLCCSSAALFLVTAALVASASVTSNLLLKHNSTSTSSSSSTTMTPPKSAKAGDKPHNVKRPLHGCCASAAALHGGDETEFHLEKDDGDSIPTAYSYPLQDFEEEDDCSSIKEKGHENSSYSNSNSDSEGHCWRFSSCCLPLLQCLSPPEELKRPDFHDFSV
jgi:uncharacterized protein